MMRFFTFLCAVALSAPLVAQASPIIRVADTVTLGVTELVQGDWYSAGGVATISGSVTGDAYIAAGTVTINAPIKEDLVILGGAVRVNADVGDDVRILGGDVTITGIIGGDIVILGGTIHITDTAKVSGDVIVMAETANIEGAVAGDIFARSTELTINSIVAGNIRAPEVTDFTLAKSAAVKGTITYSSPSELVRADTATIAGEVTYEHTALPGIDIGAIVWTFLTLLALAFAMQGVFIKKLQQFVNVAHTRRGTAALVGIGSFLAAPILAVILFALGIFAPIGGIVISLLVAYTTAAFGLVTILIGLEMYRFHIKTMTPTFTTTILGTFIMTLVIIIAPFIALLTAVTIPLGVLILETYRTLVGKK